MSKRSNNRRKNGSYKEKRFTFSKILIAIAYLHTICLTVFSIILMWRTGDLSPFMYLIPGAAAETATATGFYFWKAKRENEIRLLQKYGTEVYNDSKEVM